MSDLTLEVVPREAGGKNVNRRLRAAGQIPAVVYGGGRSPVNIQVQTRTFEKLLRDTADQNPIFLLALEGTDQKRHAMIHELHSDAVTGETLHVDFLRVDMESELEVDVLIELQGTPIGVKTHGGLLDFVTREVSIRCLPDKIPGHLDIDVSGLDVGDHVEAGQIELPDGVVLVTEAERVLVSIHAKVEVAEETEEGEEMVEPEVIGAKTEDD
ncbi:MAG: 50S ribosomal protein L25 [Acidobacteriota bacterium]